MASTAALKRLRDTDGVRKYRFFTSPDLELDGNAPLGILAEGNLERVLLAVKSFRKLTRRASIWESEMMNEIPSKTDNLESKFAEVPDDFPHVEISSAIGGFQNKLALTGRDGKYYTPGNAPAERYRQWCTCEELIQQFATQCGQAKAGEHSHIAEKDLLREYSEVATRAGCDLTIEQLKYVFRRVASELELPPPVLQERPWYPPSVHIDDSIIEEFNKRMDNLPQTKSALQRMLEQRSCAVKKNR